jgi:hypothetical protein
MISTLANHLRTARHAAGAIHRGTFARANPGNGFGLMIGQARRGRSQTGGGEVRVAIHAGHDFGLMIRSAGRKDRVGGQDINGGHGGHAEGDKEVTSFHFQFQFGPASCGTDFLHLLPHDGENHAKILIF